ncbi:hypothetical protein JCM33374_g5863 [Metschnikowia sp. JCM 33374]|nr:hypothetical protein JCM33374_g5863 [Metschnikowia sp. JCM 33374]
MDKTSQIKMLQEMGFSESQAQEALAASGYELNKAIAYLFGEVEGSAGAGTQQSPFEVESAQNDQLDSVSISNPHEIPDFLGSYASNMPLDEVRHYDRPMSSDSFDHSTESLRIRDETFKENLAEAPVSSYSSSMSTSSSEADIPGSFLDEEYPENVKTDLQNVPVILSKQRDLRCWVPLLLILAHSGSFAKPILESASDVPFVQEVQRMVYFVQNFDNSKRWYHSMDELASQLEYEAPRGSYHDEEMVLNMIEYMMKKEPALRPVFESLVHSSDEEVNKELTVLEIESDSRASTLYDKLNELFWQQDFEYLGRIKYTSVAPIVTYQVIADGHSSCVPFQLQEVVYPEIYSDKALGRVREELHSMKKAEMDYQTSTRKLMDLNFFEGKKIDGLLSQTAAALSETNSDAADNILDLGKLIQDCRVVEIENQDRAKIDSSSQKLFSFEEIIRDVPELRPYKLIGVIFSESKYLLRVKDAWIDMEVGVTIDFTSVRSIVESCRGPHLITLVYGDAKENDSTTISAFGLENNAKTENNAESEVTSIANPVTSEKPANISDPTDQEPIQTHVTTGSRPDHQHSAPKSDIRGGDSEFSNTRHIYAASNLEINGEELVQNKAPENYTPKDEPVKRPRWADAIKASGPQDAENADSCQKVNIIHVNPKVVQQFLQDEEKISNAAV